MLTPLGLDGSVMQKKNPRTVGRGGLSGCFPGKRWFLDHTFALEFLPGELALPADGLGLLARFLDGRFLEMLLELHFTKHTFALQLFL